MKILLSIALVLLSTFCFAQKLVSLSKTIIIKEKYGIKEAIYRESLPVDIKHRQSVLDINLSPKSYLIFVESGTLYAQWDISKFNEEDTITVNLTMAINKYDLETSDRKPSRVQSELELEQYLEDNKNLNITDKEIQKLAVQLKDENDENTVRNIFNFVTEHLEYHMFKKQKRSAKKL